MAALEGRNILAPFSQILASLTYKIGATALKGDGGSLPKDMSTTQDEGLEARLTFLRQQLTDVAPGALQLPGLNPRSSAGEISTNSFLFSAALSSKIRDLAHEARRTPFELLLAGFQALLFRYSRQSPIIVCMPAGDNSRVGSGRLANFFMNWMVLRTHVSAGMNFEQLTTRASDEMRYARSHNDLLFEKLIAEFEPGREPNLEALSVVAFDYQGPPSTGDSLPSSLSASRQERENGGSAGNGLVDAGGNGQNFATNGKPTFKFDLNLSMAATGTQFSGSFAYNTAMLDEAGVRGLIRHFQTLIEAAVNDPLLFIGDLPLLPVTESQKVLVEWNETQVDFPEHLCVQQLFEAQVLQTPDAPAALFGGNQLSYRELNERANRLAHHLRAQGVGPEQIVGLCLEGSLELPVAVFAVLKAGAAYLPLDPAYPAERLRYMVQDAEVKLILTQPHLTEKFAEPGTATALTIEAELKSAAGQPPENPALLTTSRNACYVIYTSGSTGRPKGIVIEHRSLVNLVGALKVICGVGPGDRVLQFASFSFDQSVREIFEPLLSGAALCLEQREQLMPGKPLLEVLTEKRITAVTLAPSVLAHLPAAELPELIRLSAGGEALPAAVVDRWAVGRSFFNAYGPSEITFASSLPRCFADAGKPTIGKPLQNTRYYVVDERLQPCAVGMTGELLVGGVGLARGYFRRADLTAERFIPDQFGRDAGGRLYRTGDLVRWLPNGDVDYLGRIDQQVKLHGLRIELGEIETVLMQHEAVVAATVTLCAETPGKEKLVAYVVTSEPELPAERLKEFLAAKLPNYMIPQVFIAIERIPLTPAGKVDKRALPLPKSIQQQKAYIPPATPAEQKMVEIWKRVLDVDCVSADDNFFELGGSSLRGTTLLALIKDEFQIKLSFAKVFEKPMLREFTELIAGNTGQMSSARGKGAVLLRKAEEPAPHIFFIHDASGEVDAILPLSNQISSVWNVWGIQAGQLDPDETPEVTLESMAAEYIEEILAVQPDGPWFVGGWSFGAVVAYEMARQLGSRIGLLTFIDAEPPNRQRWDGVLTDFVDNLKTTFKPAAAAVSSVADKSKACQLLLSRISRYQNAAERIRACTPESIAQAIAGWNELDEEHLFAALRRVMSYVGALSVYETGSPIDVDVEDFSASINAAPVNGDDWEAFAIGRVRRHRLDGDHRSILTLPVVKSLAGTLSEALQERLPETVLNERAAIG